jgi:putative ABC transport system permease protein
MKNRAVHIITVVGRLRASASIEQAEAEMRGIAQRLQGVYPGEDSQHGVVLVSLHEEIVGSARPAIMALFGAVLFVMLIACANVANLMLSRGSARQKEMAIRAALGGSRAAIARLLLTESLILALFAGGAGLILSFWSLDAILGTLPAYLPRPNEIRLDLAVLVFTFLLCLLSALAFGLSPALHASKTSLSDSLKEGASLSGGRRRNRGRGALVVAEVSLSLILLAGAGLMLKSLWLVLQVPPGFRAEQLLTVQVSLPAVEYDEPSSWVRFYRELPHRLEALPGVERVSAVNRLPISGGDAYGNLTIEGRPFPPGESPAASFRRVLPNYFRVMGVPLRQGREFNERDTGEGERVVVISETMARRYWPHGDAVGKRIKLGPPESEPWLTIVGVVGDVRNTGLDAEPALATYEPHAQRPWSSMNLVVRSHGDPLALVGALRSELRAAERQLFIGEAMTMDARISASLAPRRVNLYLLGLFAALAVGLAGLGIYGVMAYSVQQRTREIGIRMALGARSSDVRRMVLRQGLTLALGGAALGLAGSFIATRWVSSLLYGVHPADPATFAAAAILLLFVAAAACYLPARRATRVDPLVALRYE